MTFYNDNEPYVCEWLSNLISAGYLSEGLIDSRDIKEISPEDVSPFRRCHFFAGIGGWDLALKLAGWPENLPVWTGSCPCQPFSVAGKRQGTKDERHLWPEWFRLIRECRPFAVIGEQVPGTLGSGWLDGVCGDLETAGYTCGAVVLGAHSVSAPHIRQRLYWVAHADRQRFQRQHAYASGLDNATSEQMGGAGLTRENGTYRVGDSDEPGSQGCGIDPGERSHQSSAWARGQFISCLDGKTRRIGTGIQPLAARLSDSLDELRSIEARALREISEFYGTVGKADTCEAVRMVRELLLAEASGEETAIGMCRQLHAPEILFGFLLCLQSACETGESTGIKKEGIALQGRAMRMLRLSGESGRPSRQRQPTGQFAEQSPDPLQSLSFVLARLAEAYRETARNANAAVNRIPKLRAVGNSIVPQAAAVFIRSVMDVLDLQ